MPEINLNSIASTVLWATFVVTVLLGIVLQKTRFCTMGAITDIAIMGEWTRMRQWLLAIGVAIIGVGVMTAVGMIDTSKSIYTGSRLTWLSTIVGSLMFGFGMVLASGCGSKTLLRIGSGNLKSLVVFLTLALSSYMTLRGVFGVFRVNTTDTVFITLSTQQDLPSVLAASMGIAKDTLQISLALIIGGALIVFALIKKEFWSFNNLLAGFGVGAAVLLVWWISGVLGYVAEDPNTLEEVFVATNSGRMESLTYVAPYAYVIEWLTFFSDASRKITLGVASIKLGLKKKLILGNLNAKRDWGYAEDYVEGMYKMMQHGKPDDYVLSTNETHTIKEFVELACKECGWNITWEGEGENEKGLFKTQIRKIVWKSTTKKVLILIYIF